VYYGARDKVFNRGDDTPPAAWGGFGDRPTDMHRVVGELVSMGIPRRTLGDVITGAGR
jgi:hypothetical protein